MIRTDLVYLGIKGSVLALDKTNGKRIWETKLKGGSFVSLLVEKDRIYAGTQGEIFCLDAATGRTLWQDGLSGYGLGLLNIASETGSSSLSAVAAEHAQQQQQAATVASTGAIAAGS